MRLPLPSPSLFSFTGENMLGERGVWEACGFGGSHYTVCTMTFPFFGSFFKGGFLGSPYFGEAAVFGLREQTPRGRQEGFGVGLGRQEEEGLDGAHMCAFKRRRWPSFLRSGALLCNFLVPAPTWKWSIGIVLCPVCPVLRWWLGPEADLDERWRD